MSLNQMGHESTVSVWHGLVEGHKWVIRLGQTVNGRRTLSESSQGNIHQVEKGLDEVKSFEANSRLQINISEMNKPCSYL